MQEAMKVIDGILAALDTLERPLEVLLITAIFLLEKRLKQNTAAISPVVKETKPAKTSANRKKEVQAEMTKAVELYFSGKSLDEMTDEEKAMYERVAAYFGG